MKQRTKSSNCRISIIIPTYNSFPYIGECLGSLEREQNWLYEIIIVDGKSTDGSQEIVNQFASRCHITKVICEPDLGQSDAMNKGLMLASGNVIGFLNADDYLYPGSISQVISLFESDPLIDIVIGGLLLSVDGLFKYQPPSAHPYHILNFTNYKWPLNPASYFCSKELHDTIGLFPVDNHYNMDYWFLLRALYLSKRVATTNVVFGCYRIHRNSKTSNNPSAYQQTKACRLNFLVQWKPLRWAPYTLLAYVEQIVRESGLIRHLRNAKRLVSRIASSILFSV